MKLLYCLINKVFEGESISLNDVRHLTPKEYDDLLITIKRIKEIEKINKEQDVMVYDVNTYQNKIEVDDKWIKI